MYCSSLGSFWLLGSNRITQRLAFSWENSACHLRQGFALSQTRAPSCVKWRVLGDWKSLQFLPLNQVSPSRKKKSTILGRIGLESCSQPFPKRLGPSVGLTWEIKVLLCEGASKASENVKASENTFAKKEMLGWGLAGFLVPWKMEKDNREGASKSCLLKSLACFPRKGV